MLPKAVMVPHIFTSPNYIFAVYTVFFFNRKEKVYSRKLLDANKHQQNKSTKDKEYQQT